MTSTPTVAAPTAGVVTQTRRPSEKAPAGQNRAGWLLSSPFIALYVIFLIGPVLIGTVISLFNTTTVTPGLGDFVGFSNYVDVLTNGDFWASMWHSVFFTVLTTPLLVLLPLLFAILAARLTRGRWFYRLAFFGPYVVPSSAVCLIFAFMYTPQTGLISNAFGWFGLTAPDFLGTTSGAWFAVVLLTLWWTFGFNFILYTAALQEISEEVYEAAAIDGANAWQTFWKITFPLLKPGHYFVATVAVIGALQLFDQARIIGGSSGDPNYALMTIVLYLYREAIANFNFGYAAAVGIVLFVIIFTATVIQRRLFGQAPSW
jgi:multiple sugar transport system permease protein